MAAVKYSILILALVLVLAVAPVMVESTLSEDCADTLSRAPPECVEELKRAIYTGSTAGSFGKFQVSSDCCLNLVCIREPTCAAELHDYCPPSGVPCPSSHH